MNADDHDLLLARLTHLERSSASLRHATRCLGAATFVLAALLAALAGFGRLSSAHADDKEKVVEAESFVLKGKDGKVRGRWGVYDTGTNLQLFDSQGRPVVFLGINDNDSVYFNLRSGREARVLMGVTAEGSAYSNWRDAKGDARIQMNVEKEGAAQLAVCDTKGTVVFKAPK